MLYLYGTYTFGTKISDYTTGVLHPLQGCFTLVPSLAKSLAKLYLHDTQCYVIAVRCVSTYSLPKNCN